MYYKVRNLDVYSIHCLEQMYEPTSKPIHFACFLHLFTDLYTQVIAISVFFFIKMLNISGYGLVNKVVMVGYGWL